MISGYYCEAIQHSPAEQPKLRPIETHPVYGLNDNYDPMNDPSNGHYWAVLPMNVGGITLHED
ncbi:hypothetical protein [uncultured Tolumonas sp.]|uniref:hypothetical protein n=1 Tax=uncultured Tolumonas sp. TaxID=263765 RepID=UPI00292FECE4|nr:hypothetical protein [uncultured Tolumonas sp.]